jgi:hypothetical protein
MGSPVIAFLKSSLAMAFEASSAGVQLFAGEMDGEALVAEF